MASNGIHTLSLSLLIDLGLPLIAFTPSLSLS